MYNHLNMAYIRVKKGLKLKKSPLKTDSFFTLTNFPYELTDIFKTSV